MISILIIFEQLVSKNLISLYEGITYGENLISLTIILDEDLVIELTQR